MKPVVMKSLWAAAALAAAAAPASAQPRPMEIADLFEIRSVRSAEIAPDGSRIAYTVRDPRNVVAGEEDGAPDTELWVASGPGAARAFVADGPVSDIDWRPGSRTVSFLSEREGDAAAALYGISLFGGEAERIFAHDAAIESYAWGPEGRMLYFIAEEEADPAESAREARGFRADVYEEDPTFSHVWRVDLAAAEPAAERLDLPGHALDVVVDPQGERIAAALAPTPLVDDRYMERRWHVADAATGEVVSTVETPGKTGEAAFSPDGARLAFLAGVDRSDPIAGTLHVADAGTGGYEAVATDAEQHVQGLAWADAESVMALVHAGLESALVRYGVDGEEIERRAFDAFVAREMDLDAQTGMAAIVADAPTHPRELFVADSAEFERWTRTNPQLADMALGEQRGYEFTARDGVGVQGVLITPLGERPRGGWPLIMTVHGGPEAHDSDGWLTSYSDPGHIAAGQGFAVFYPNYRGSTGRGQDFARLDHADPPGAEFNDLVDAIGALSDDGIVDEDRVGITGGSYGGFASAWGATIGSEHFAASVPFVALTDLVSFYGTTEIPIEMVDVHFMDAPWEAWTTYLEQSPIYNAPGSTTPTLILHGEADTRVDTSQSFELYRYLEMTGEAPVRLVTYPGEGHGNDMAAAQFDYAHRMMRWMRRYLQEDGGDPPPADLDWDALLPSEE